MPPIVVHCSHAKSDYNASSRRPLRVLPLNTADQFDCYSSRCNDDPANGRFWDTEQLFPGHDAGSDHRRHSGANARAMDISWSCERTSHRELVGYLS
ncbi:MAG: hypothetical protein ACJAZO_003908 [Myxococcota bacterium]|jgi:hypothetical protein